MKNYVKILILYLKSSLCVIFLEVVVLKRYAIKILCAVVILGLLAWEYIPGPRKSTLDALTLGVDEVTPLSLELIYEGDKPEGVGSVQSIAITDDYFIIAGRPRGSAAEGGETNNQLIIVDRDELLNVTGNFFASGETMELGHANGMTYNSVTNELIVVGIRGDNGDRNLAARVDAETFRMLETFELPTDATGIAYGDDGLYYLRSGTSLLSTNSIFGDVIAEQYTNTMFTNQDIGYHNGSVYMINFIDKKSMHDAWKVGLDMNENIIYQFDIENESLRAYIVKEPYLEMESIDFANGKAYVLMNGTGLTRGRYYIYEAKFDID
jgi:hypothetical protein